MWHSGFPFGHCGSHGTPTRRAALPHIACTAPRCTQQRLGLCAHACLFLAWQVHEQARAPTVTARTTSTPPTSQGSLSLYSHSVSITFPPFSPTIPTHTFSLACLLPTTYIHTHTTHIEHTFVVLYPCGRHCPGVVCLLRRTCHSSASCCLYRRRGGTAWWETSGMVAGHGWEEDMWAWAVATACPPAFLPPVQHNLHCTMAHGPSFTNCGNGRAWLTKLSAAEILVCGWWDCQWCSVGPYGTGIPPHTHYPTHPHTSSSPSYAPIPVTPSLLFSACWY